MPQFYQTINLLFFFLISIDTRYGFQHHQRAWKSRVARSQKEQRREILSATRYSSYKWPRFTNNVNRRGLDPGKSWSVGRTLANHPYVSAYRESANQPLSYIKQTYWPRKGYKPSLWNNVPVEDVPASLYYNPIVRPAYSLWGNAKSRNVLQTAADFRSNVDVDKSFVEERIQEYYDQRLNKDKNKWLFKPVQGTSPHLKDIFIGRCWDFIDNKGKYLQNPGKLDCQKLWKAFLKSFAFKDPCDVTLDDYTHFFNMYEEKPLKDKVYISFVCNRFYMVFVNQRRVKHSGEEKFL